MPEPKRTISDLRNRERGREEPFLEGYTDVEWEMVSVLWVDAESDGGSGWQDPEEMMEYARRPLPVIHTVGLLVHEDEEQISHRLEGARGDGLGDEDPPAVGEGLSSTCAGQFEAGSGRAAAGVQARPTGRLTGNSRERRFRLQCFVPDGPIV